MLLLAITYELIFTWHALIAYMQKNLAFSQSPAHISDECTIGLSNISLSLLSRTGIVAR